MTAIDTESCHIRSAPTAATATSFARPHEAGQSTSSRPGPHHRCRTVRATTSHAKAHPTRGIPAEMAEQWADCGRRSGSRFYRRPADDSTRRLPFVGLSNAIDARSPHVLGHRARLHVPNIRRIFGDCTIAGKLSRAGHVQNGLAGPCTLVGIQLDKPAVGFQVGSQVGQVHVVIAIFQKRIQQRSEDCPARDG